MEQGKATLEQKTLTVPSPEPLGSAHLFLLKEREDQVKRSTVRYEFCVPHAHVIQTFGGSSCSYPSEDMWDWNVSQILRDLDLVQK